MEGIKVKLASLKVSKLYDCYDYDIKFNPDVTFIYGQNGCGKTTILNITEAIITGKLFKLFYYGFCQIKLEYFYKDEPDKMKSIIIKKKEDKLLVTFNNGEYEIERKNNQREFRRARITDYDCYFNDYDFLEKIKNTFNYVYLPLNRQSNWYDNKDERNYIMRKMRTRFMELNDIYEEDSVNKDVTMRRIECLIYDSYSKINSEISKISDDFRDEILKSSLTFSDSEYSIKSVAEELSSQNVDELNSVKDTYIKMLKELAKITRDEEEKFNDFFDDFIKLFSNYKKKKHNIEKFNLIELIMKFQQILRIKDLVGIAEKTERRKDDKRKPIRIFIDIMNEFVRNGEEEKKIEIDSFGKVYFTTKYSGERCIDIQSLSSGEKQLITFFAHLIFNVKNTTSGIFVVDEPELSLHLSWQQKFVEKILEINSNIQLIFATHSPEIIGKNRNKVFKLEKKYVGKAGE